MILGLDIDGVFANFTTAYADLLIQVSGEDKLPEGWRTNPDFPSTWFWERAVGYSADVEREAWEKHILRNGKFWQELQPLPYAKETCYHLNTLAKRGTQLYFLTNRAGNKAKLQTEHYLYDLGIDFPTVLLSGDKLPLIKSLGIDFFIDDKPETVIEVAIDGCVKHLFLMDAPYNRQVKAGKRVSSVKEALEVVGLWKNQQ